MNIDLYKMFRDRKICIKIKNNIDCNWTKHNIIKSYRTFDY